MRAALTPTRLVSIAVAAVCLALAGYLALSQRGERELERAQDDVAAGRHASALERTADLDGQATARAAAVRAGAHLGRREYRPAHRWFRAALRRDPNNWVLHRDDALVLLAIGRRVAARREIQRALALNPRMELPPGFVASGG